MTAPPGDPGGGGGGGDRTSGGFGRASGSFGVGDRWLGDRESIVGTLVDPPRALAEGDLEPPSMLRRADLDSVAVVWGLVASVAIHLVLPMAATLLALLVLRGGGATVADPEDEAEPERTLAVVETKFVKLGRPFDPRELPNRRVPQRSTAPRERERAPAKRADETPAEVPPDAGPPPEDAVEDLLTRLGTRADALAKLSEQDYSQEGDVQGVQGGTETRETGSIYPGRLRSFFRRGFTVPTHIPDEDLQGLRTVVRIEITGDGRLGEWRVTRPSGNADFDAAVERRLRQADGANLPDVPEDEAERFLGHATNVAFTP